MDRDESNEWDLTLFFETAEAAGHSIYITDRQGTIEYVNPAFEETTGYSASEAVGQNASILKSEEHDREFYEELWDTILSGDVWRSEIINRRKDGTKYVADQTIAPIEKDGEITNFVAINVDITDRKEQERDLERFRNAVEHAGHSVVITNEQGTIEYVNRAFEELSGYSAAEAIGRTPAILKSGEHDEEFYEELWETILSGEIWQGEVINKRKDGTQYILAQTIAPITENGDIAGFVAINRDITQLKQYRSELENQNERLSEYGQTVAHDLRNPLNVLQSELEALYSHVAETDLDESEVETLTSRFDNLTEIIEQMEQLIEDLLTMAEQGQFVIEAERVSLESASRRAWEQTAGGGGATWEVDQPDADLSVDETEIRADPERLTQLLANLFRNALEHGGEDVSVHVGPLDFDDGFYVEDDGPGIPADKREDVFERGMTTSDDGTGFGLAIVAQIADAHGWRVSVTEGSMEGARFEFVPTGDAVSGNSLDAESSIAALNGAIAGENKR